jgi:transposase InsO family protein
MSSAHIGRIKRSFYDLYDIPERLGDHSVLLHPWEETYNNDRPHQALGYLIPNEYLTEWQATHR